MRGWNRKHILFPTQCFYCQVVLKDRFEHTYDHIHPLSLGGPDTIHNLVDCCKKCNKLKASLTLQDFKIKVEDLLTHKKDNAEYRSYLNSLKQTLEEIFNED